MKILKYFFVSFRLLSNCFFIFSFSKSIGILNSFWISSDLSNNESDVYLCWEISLLRELGYALDFSRCSGCGKTTDLNYLSPRTGRAVCDTCAVPYIDRLYKLPVDLNITGCFLDAVCTQQGVQIPIMRKMLKVM